MNILMCSVGRRGELLKDFKNSMSENSKIIATDLSPYAPALYFADKSYLVPGIEIHRILTLLLIFVKKNRLMQ